MRNRAIILSLFAGALAIRLVYVWEIRENPFFENPVLDEAVHYRWAESLARGASWFPGKPFFRAPLYPYFLSVLFRLAGPTFLFPRVVQAIVTSIGPVLLLLLGRVLLPRGTGVVAAIAALFYGMVLYFDESLLIVSILLPLVLLLLLLLARASDGPPRPAAWFASGFVLGLTAIARPNILLFGCALPFWIAFLYGRRRQAFRRALLPLAAGALLPIAPVFLHNLSTGEPVLIAWQGGTNFYIGNNPESDGMTAIAPGTGGTWWGGYADMIRIAEEDAGRPLARREVSRYWLAKSLAFQRSNPRAALRLYAKKAYLLVNDFEVSNNQGIYFFRRYSRILSVLSRFGFGMLLPLAAAGAAFVRWDRRRALLLVYLGTYASGIVLFFVTSRYRMPLVPVLLLLAAVALVHWARIATDGWSRRSSLSVLLFAAFFLVANSNLYGLDRGREAQGQYNVGVVHLSARRFAEAIPHFRAALDEEPAYRNARYNLGLCYSYLGRLDEARAELEPLVAGAPAFTAARIALASVLRRQGDREGALEQLEEVPRADPRCAEARRAREAILGETVRGEREEANGDRPAREE